MIIKKLNYLFKHSNPLSKEKRVYIVFPEGFSEIRCKPRKKDNGEGTAVRNEL